MTRVHLIDGTYELFRHYYALPHSVTERKEEVGAVKGVAASLLYLLEEGATHVAVATDHVIESFRNELWDGYKDGSGIEPELRSQFELLEDTLRALGFRVWAMVEYEADDALAAGAAVAAADPDVDQVWICTPDKDLAQCVVGKRVVQYDRRQRLLRDESGVIEKFGVLPESIPDYLALVGDNADGFPGLAGWGAKTSASVLSKYKHLENIPLRAKDWEVSVRGADKLAETLHSQMDLALLFRRLATLVVDGPVRDSVSDWNWAGPNPELSDICQRLEAPELMDRVIRLETKRSKDIS